GRCHPDQSLAVLASADLAVKGNSQPFGVRCPAGLTRQRYRRTRKSSRFSQSWMVHEDGRRKTVDLRDEDPKRFSFITSVAHASPKAALIGTWSATAKRDAAPLTHARTRQQWRHGAAAFDRSRYGSGAAIGVSNSGPAPSGRRAVWRNY